MSSYFSIIIPVYNAAPYLRECLDSVLAQTITDWEAICVDDGSTDGSGDILDEYALKDSRIKVYHQENKGVSAARQLGLDSSSGDWITWVDPDDWVDSDMLEQFEKFLRYNPCELVWSDYWVHEATSTHKVDCDFSEDASVLVKEALDGRFMGFVWMKLFSRALIERAKADFPKYYVTCWEDLYFVLKCLVKKPKVGHMRHAFYHYMVRDSSPIHLCKSAGMQAKYRLIVDMEKISPWPELKAVHAFRKQSFKFSSCINRFVSFDEWKSFFPEITSLSDERFSLPSRIIFSLSIHGMRKPALLLLCVAHSVKSVIRKIRGMISEN